MSLQATTEVAASPRVPLPELPELLHDRLCAFAVRHGVPVDDVAEFIFKEPKHREFVDGRTIRALTAPKSYTGAAPRFVECRTGGGCKAPFRWRGQWRCGCPAPNSGSWGDL